MRFKVLLTGFATMLFSLIFSASLLHAKILIVAPHPDDDVLMAAGIVLRAVERGEAVRVIYMTNGDYYGSQHGYSREIEAVTGQSYLGVPENNLIFLGYPDGYLNTLYTSYPNATDQFISPNGISATYGTRGLGSMDYHSYRFGTPARYNRANIITDLTDIISSFQPDHIFVPSEFDAHTDHVTTYQLIRIATISVCNNNPGYEPVIHKNIIWWINSAWPNSADPAALLAEIPALSSTGLSWTNRESFNVPLSMQLPNYSDNPKALALNAHADDQKGVYGYIGRFLHKDEVFWPENVTGSNRPPIVNAGPDQEVIQGTSVSLDGSQSMDPDGAPLTYTWTQKSGISVQLLNASSSSPSFTAPAGLTQDEILNFELVVSDGRFVSLPDSVSVKVLVSQTTVTNIAPLAIVTASTENSQYGQTAAKAVDGVIDGYPNDGTREWSTNGQRAGAWLNLAWSQPYTVNRIVLHDRINLDDNITSATITFSDGSTLTVGPLNHDGTSTVYSFPAKVINGLRMTVTGVSSTTYEIGLAEIEVYGNAAPQTQYTLTTNVSPSGSGSVTASPSQAGYYSGTQVALTANPNTGYTFSGWSGGASGTTNPVAITLTGNTSVTANFTPIPGTLTVTPSTGLTASGAPGGPFTPSGATYTLFNAGNSAINWSASSTQNWITLSSNSGSLAPGASAAVTVSIDIDANNLAAGSYTDTITFSNLTNGNGSTTRNVSLAVAVQTTNIAPLAAVTASSESAQYGQTAVKAVDGVVDGYPHDETREWATSNRQRVGAWLNLAWSQPYSVNRIVLHDRINLDDNITSATITFSDGSSINVGPLNNDGSATTYTFPARVITSLRMTVTGVSGSTYETGLAEIEVFGNAVPQTQYPLTTNVSPSGSGSVTASPSQAGYYSGTQVTLTANPNTGYTFSGWSGGASGTTNPVAITITGNTSVTANFIPIPGTLTVTPSTGLTASGAPGGPFTPSGATYTLLNAGNSAINWSASSTQNWITLSSNSGSLAPGASAAVTVSIDSDANNLAAGSYTDTIAFTNLTNGNGSTTRNVSLAVAVQTTNIAPLAAVTASSESAQYGQTAVKAVDGVVDGYPHDGTREWSTTNRQRVGAWLNLAWSQPYSVNRVVLHDRINLDDNITSATITFSDGSSINVGPLNNDGSATTYTFPARVITWLRMTVTGVSGSTYETGLAEIEVFGNAVPQTQYTLTTNVSPSGSGSVTASPSQAGYYSGTQVTLTANPNTGYTFSGWSGGASGTTNPVAITITGNTSVTANFTPIPGTLTVTPSTGLTASGAPGGPFTPSGATYTLLNAGNSAINWSASSTQNWITLSSNSGSLAPGASAAVTVSIDSDANNLAAGSYADTIAFSNLTNGNGSTTRNVSLAVAVQTTNIAPLASVTASSESAQYGQTAVKAVDGVVDGYPHDGTREWSSNRQHAGAWLNLSWSQPYSVNRIVLHDRINLDDNITSATITFSDGSSINVGPLNNDGSATTYTFPARTITWLRMTVTGVSGSTYETGLAEVEVYGY